MMKREQKSWLLILVALLGASWLLTSCSKSKTQYVTTIVQTAADGLDLQAVTDLSTKSKDAKDFETKLNAPGNTVNNLDLNEDDVIDFIKVTEVHDNGARGFSLTTEVAEGDEQELCTIQFEEENGQASVHTQGNQSMYGSNSHYHYRTGLGDVLIWSYLLNSRSPYVSRWGWNDYPSNYQRSRPRGYQEYRSQHKNKSYGNAVKKVPTSQAKTKMKSPNFNKTATKIKAPLKNPTSSQRSFQKRNPSKSVARGGFGSSKAKPSGSRAFGSKASSGGSSRFGSWSSSRSGSSFGGGK